MIKLKYNNTQVKSSITDITNTHRYTKILQHHSNNKTLLPQVCYAKIKLRCGEKLCQHNEGSLFGAVQVFFFVLAIGAFITVTIDRRARRGNSAADAPIPDARMY